ncbi:hypothetical protein RN001_012394 [Aquatica leii]|uniref:Uncharacterized protein n=1 Tax=Aquatica leii TaxID=1421715 RepID=A0AAN7SDA1_9COLE|nr:hypothetical protein RN001_012394 [Aquatica leii]
MKSHCRVSSNMIRYLIEVPLYLENKYELYQLTPIPTFINQKMVTLNIPQKLVCKDNDKIYDTKNCVFNKGYYCESNFMETNECINQLFQNQLQLQKCNYHVIENDFHIYQIENSPYVIVVSPDEKLINIECPNYSKKINLKGIYKFNNKEDCKINDIYFWKQILGQELVFENLKLTELNNNVINTSSVIELKNIKNMYIKSGNNPLIKEIQVENNHHIYTGEGYVRLVFEISTFYLPGVFTNPHAPTYFIDL